MDINNFRKNIFLNSQYCTRYFDGETTVLAGILRDFGYKYQVKLPQEKLSMVSMAYRNFSTAINSCVALFIILYIYFVVFPHFTDFLKMPFIQMVLLLSLIPLLALILIYFFANLCYENYLNRHIGTYQKIKFKPSANKIDELEFETYTKTPRKSVYIVLVILLMFCYYVITPLIIAESMEKGKFHLAYNLSNVYTKLIPINPEVYAYKAYALYKDGAYKSAAVEFEKANKYSNSNNYDEQILGLRTYYLPFDEMLNEFDNAIEQEEEIGAKYVLKYEKAKYLQKHKQYNQALAIYTGILKDYENGATIYCAPENLYYKSGQVKNILNPNSGDFDMKVATNMSSELDIDCESGIIHMP